MINAFDVVVIGAGPAGSAAALALAQKGKRVALLDRAVFPRPKICGNCINPRSWKIWKKLGLTESFKALPHALISGFTVECEGKLVHRDIFQPPLRGPRAVARDLLDDWLRQEAQAAGVEFFPETSVTHVHANGTVETAQGVFSGKLIFGADGRNSMVGRQARLMPPPHRCHRIAWQTTIPAPINLDGDIHMQVYKEGYFGYCRYSPDRAVVSMVLDARASQDPDEVARRFFPHFPTQEWMRMNPITRAPARLGSGRIWLVGDAARVVEPFTGEGISFALATGVLAAENALRALEHDEIEAGLKAYADAHKQLYIERALVNTLVRWAIKDSRWIVKLLRHVNPPHLLSSILSRHVHTA